MERERSAAAGTRALRLEGNLEISMSEKVTAREAQGKVDSQARRNALAAGQQHIQPAFNPLLSLQRMIGNQAVLRLLDSGAIQAKLRISQPGDSDEIEADRVADQIVSAGHAPALQRKCSCSAGASCPKCEEDQEKLIHRSAAMPLLRSSQLSIQRFPADDSIHAAAPCARSCCRACCGSR
jgi:hypothetical protein